VTSDGYVYRSGNNFITPKGIYTKSGNTYAGPASFTTQTDNLFFGNNGTTIQAGGAYFTDGRSGYVQVLRTGRSAFLVLPAPHLVEHMHNTQEEVASGTPLIHVTVLFHYCTSSHTT
jgi:hypothetical protein